MYRLRSINGLALLVDRTALLVDDHSHALSSTAAQTDIGWDRHCCAVSTGNEHADLRNSVCSTAAV